MSAKIEMLNDAGCVTEICDAHACDGSPDACEYPADCEDCGESAAAELIVYVWTVSIGIDHWCCATCLRADAYARLQEIASGTNPETGETIACHTDAEGNPQAALSLPLHACLNHDLSFATAADLTAHLLAEHV